MVSAKKKTRTVNKINKIKSCFAESVSSSKLATMTKTVVSKKKKKTSKITQVGLFATSGDLSWCAVLIFYQRVSRLSM